MDEPTTTRVSQDSKRWNRVGKILLVLSVAINGWPLSYIVLNGNRTNEFDGVVTMLVAFAIFVQCFPVTFLLAVLAGIFVKGRVCKVLAFAVAAAELFAATWPLWFWLFQQQHWV